MAKYAERLLAGYLGSASPTPQEETIMSREPLERQGSEESVFASIPDAVAAIARGEIIVVVDDEDRENEGDLIMAAEAATPETITFFVRHTSGVICAPLTGDRLDELDIPLMVRDNTESHRTAFTYSVDYVHGTSTGISAADRAATIRSLIDPATRPADLARPGHIFPLRYSEGGVLKRAGHTEAAVDLARLAGMDPAGVLCEIVNDDGTMARVPDLIEFCKEHGLLMVTIAQLIKYRRQNEKLIRRVAEARIPTPWGDFTSYVYESVLDGEQHVAMVRGAVQGESDVLVRVHSECLTGDVFHSLRCDCGRAARTPRWRRSPTRASACSCTCGATRAAGSASATRSAPTASRRRAATPSTPTSSSACPVDSREYGIGAQILNDLGITTMRLMTNNPSKFGGLEGFGLEITDRVPLESAPNPENIEYLRTKRERMGHLLEGLD